MGVIFCDKAGILCVCWGETRNALCILPYAGQSHTMKNSPTTHATLKNSKQVAVDSTTLGGTIYLHDGVSGCAVHNLHNWHRGPRLDSDPGGKNYLQWPEFKPSLVLHICTELSLHGFNTH